MMTATAIPSTNEAGGARLLTAQELGERWQTSRQHVYRLSREGKIPSVRIGRYPRFRLSAIQEWEAAQETAA